MRKLIISKRELKFENQVLNSENKLVGKIASEYAKSKQHFDELYKIGIKKWYKVENSISAKNVNKFGALIIRQEIVNYTLKMENKNLELKKLQDEVVDFYSKIEKELGEEIDCKIFYSQFSSEADILFIGINPGTGETGIGHDVKPMNNFAYLDWKNSVNISRETIEVFEKANYPNLLKNLDKKNKIVKTNLYYLATKGTKDLDGFKSTLSPNLRKNFIKNSIKWTTKIIELTNPKIIIYEGKYAFDECPPFNGVEILEKINENGVYYTKFENYNFSMIGYSRQPKDRNIVKNKFAEILKIELDKIYT